MNVIVGYSKDGDTISKSGPNPQSRIGQESPQTLNFYEEKEDKEECKSKGSQNVPKLILEASSDKAAEMVVKVCDESPLSSFIGISTDDIPKLA